MSALPVDEPASITYEVGASPPVGGDQVNVTMAPLTVAVSGPGTPGAVSGAAAADAGWRIATRVVHPETPNAACVTPPLANQDHDTVPGALAGVTVPDSGATRSAVV